MRRIAALLLVFLAALVFPAQQALAFQPPPLVGHVVDTSGKLEAGDVSYLEGRLEEVNAKTGFEIAVLVTGSLDGETIDDVAYTTFNTWGVGHAGRDDGVLLVIALADRKVRIETGKGVGGLLTDLQSSDIIEHTIGPRLADGHVREAIDDGTQAIAQDLGAGSPTADKSPPHAAPGLWKVLLFVGLALVVILLAIVSPGFRQMLFLALAFGGRSFFGGGGGGGGGSSSAGGGGRSGGGGASGGF